ncbi:AraC family transcriptional regulator [Microbulbifer celer]|uniref:Helix-turn-helix domain-containing protein n=1 Tax=Microbulbifer celer TaxID=435905 RepID=A0ABW3U2Q1_9GAMM|nr:helix-turn-helix domain-containing protein [Microbulbifer celer]UFN56117.1 helix-turn-helix domain-containing protein [Microbulbifer celer]
MQYAFFTGATCSLLLLASVRIGLSRHGGAPWIQVLIAGAFLYLLRPLLDVQQPAVDLLIDLPTMLCPAAFWLFAHHLCSESQQFPRWGRGLIAVDFLLGLAAQFELHPLLYPIEQPFKLALIGLGLLTLLEQLQSDLVAERRQLRIALLIAIGGYMVIVVCAEFLFSYYPVPRGIPAVHSLMTWILTFAACMWLLALSPKALEENLPQRMAEPDPAPSEAPEKDAAPLDPSQQQLLYKLQLHMEQGGYRHTGLTIRELAEQLDAREHVLRALINRHLGYRNFNEYLNRYRVDEASRRLADPGEAHLPVLTIALDIGYRSLSPFNAAFKRHHNLTPTEYRRQQLPA